eukprot:CAMPEP_0117647800 /NCGR_PEP_ID=MMETSP0804-20121206/42_1 /TAXON_ID=1074897 /ORGANISM="Tetraselmis astigmatica, Strain CCMP880" /LENGTH=52 /DNA_ID=CAMNT_0005453315 /DNA_START=153 /DNA_END=308 /DNA_ORIENTATION=-
MAASEFNEKDEDEGCEGAGLESQGGACTNYIRHPLMQLTSNPFSGITPSASP